MGEKVLKVGCDWCGKEIDCPESMLKVDKHMCYDCLQKHEEDLQVIEPGKVHIDFPREELEEMVATRIAEKLFPMLWNENKESFKQMSKKELARNMFIAGAATMLENMKETNQNEEEEKTERK